MTLVPHLSNWMNTSILRKVPFRFHAKLKNNVLPNGVVSLGKSSRKYVQSVVQNVQEYLVTLPGDHKFLKNAYGPFSGGTSLSLMGFLSWTP
jgi:hypothetical protein